MSRNPFTHTMLSESNIVEISTTGQRGYFAHLLHSEDLGGHIYFENNVLIAFSGVSQIPEEVQELIISKGFIIPAGTKKTGGAYHVA